MSTLRKFGAVAGLAMLAACARQLRPPAELESIQPDIVGDGAAMIITPAVLQSQNRSLLDVMQARLPSMTVVPTQPCPEVFLRGRSTIATPSNPAIYVDGQISNNTCVLDMVNALNLDHVEVYPSGQPRGGYLSSPYGVILIFTRTS